MAEQINKMLSDLYSIGMIKKEYEHSTVTFYYLDNKQIYNWSSGIPTEKMYNELTEVHKQYYKQSEAV
jgi:predicted transcriptional regulator